MGYWHDGYRIWVFGMTDIAYGLLARSISGCIVVPVTAYILVTVRALKCHLGRMDLGLSLAGMLNTLPSVRAADHAPDIRPPSSMGP